jgi:hypothetical protein
MIGASLRALQFRFLLSDVNVALRCHDKSNIVVDVCQTFGHGRVRAPAPPTIQKRDTHPYRTTGPIANRSIIVYNHLH